MPTWRLKVNKKIFPNSYGYFQLGGLYIVSYFSVLSWHSETGIYCFQNENQAFNYDAILFVKPEKLLKELVLLPFPQWRLELWFWANCPSFQDRLDLRVSSMFPRPHEFLAKVQEAFLTLLGTESSPTLQLLDSEQQDASSIHCWALYSPYAYGGCTGNHQDVPSSLKNLLPEVLNLLADNTLMEWPWLKKAALSKFKASPWLPHTQ